MIGKERYGVGLDALLAGIVVVERRRLGMAHCYDLLPRAYRPNRERIKGEGLSYRKLDRLVL